MSRQKKRKAVTPATIIWVAGQNGYTVEAPARSYDEFASIARSPRLSALPERVVRTALIDSGVYVPQVEVDSDEQSAPAISDGVAATVADSNQGPVEPPPVATSRKRVGWKKQAIGWALVLAGATVFTLWAQGVFG